MKKKKLVAVALATAMVMTSFAGCGSKSDKKSKANGSADYSIGVIQLTEHPALDKANEGFVAGLKEEGISADIDQQNAQNDQSACDTIATKFVNDKKDLVCAIATPAAQAIAGKTTDIPIVVTAVTDPENSGLVDSNKKPGNNVTGTSDLTPVKEQIDLLSKLLPEAKTVGVLYCSAEDNSLFQAKIAKKEIEAKGLKCKEYTVSSTNEIQSVVESMAGKVDAIYSPTDNMIAQGMTTVTMIANQNKIPCIVGEEGMVENGGLATYGIDYYNLGKMTAKMAAKILKGESVPADMAIEYEEASQCKLSVNEDAAKELGIDLTPIKDQMAK